MWGRLGPRFALEAAFLILLAVGLGLADQDWIVVVAVMAGGWALVSLIELVASRRPPWPAVERRPVEEPAPAPEPAVEPPAAVEEPPAPLPEPVSEVGIPAEPVVDEAAPVMQEELPPQPAPSETEAAPAEPGAPEPEAAPPEPAPAAAAGEETQEVRVPDGEEERPRRRRWFRRRVEERAEIPEPPKHVRKLGPEEPAETRAAAEAGDE